MITNPITLARLIWKEYKVSWALAKAIAVAEVATSYRDLLLEKEKLLPEINYFACKVGILDYLFLLTRLLQPYEPKI